MWTASRWQRIIRAGGPLAGSRAGDGSDRLIRLDQPIVENYVGRQVPTAMVARNLERGSGFFCAAARHRTVPELLHGRAAVYQLVAVGLRETDRLDSWKPAAGLVSALATALGAWGLFGLVRRREGNGRIALRCSRIAFFPITIRYGRAFQPDALMLGALSAGLNCWDRIERGHGRRWRILRRGSCWRSDSPPRSPRPLSWFPCVSSSRGPRVRKICCWRLPR